MRKLNILIILVILTMCNGKIQISIKTSNNLVTTLIEHYGSDIKQVTDKEVTLFNVTHENLNRGVRVELGKVPNEIFLKDPTDYGNVYEKYKWPDVKRKISVKNIATGKFINEKVVIKRVDHVNNSTDAIKSKIEVSEQVINTVNAIWNKQGLPGDDIKYDVLIDFGYGIFVYEANWRDSNVKIFDTTIRKTEGVLEIKSGQSVVAKLVADRVKLLLEVEMDVLLVGNLVANYAHTYGKYHLYSPTIGNIMKAAGLINEIPTKFLLEVNCYTNPKLEFIDKDTGAEIFIEKKKVQKKLRWPRYYHKSNKKLNQT